MCSIFPYLQWHPLDFRCLFLWSYLEIYNCVLCNETLDANVQFLIDLYCFCCYSPNYFTLTLLLLQNKSHDLITHTNLPQSLQLKPSIPLKYKNLTTESVHLVTFYNSLFSLFLKMLQYILLPPLFYVNFHYNMKFLFSLNSINTFRS